MVKKTETTPKIQPCPAEITRTVGRVTCFWKDSGTEIVVTDIKTRSDGVDGIYSIFHRNGNGTPQRWVTGVKQNFVTPLSRKNIAAQLETAALRFAGKSEYDWDSVVEQLSGAVIDSEAQHNEYDEVNLDDYDFSESNHQFDYLIDPIIHRSGVTMLYAFGGSCKGFLAVLIGLMVESGESYLGWKVNKPERVLYLDWEDTKDEYKARCARVREGCGVGKGVKNMHRMGMHTTLMSSLPEIAERIQKIRAKFVIVDALGGATAGNLMLPEDSGNFYSKLSQITGVTWLVLHHRTKPQKNDPSDKKSMMGSAYWENNARATIKMKATKHPTLERTMDVDMENDKNNRDQTAPPKLLRIQFDGRYGPVSILERQPEDKAQEIILSLAKNSDNAVCQRVIQALGLKAMTPADIAAITGDDPQLVRLAISRNKGVFARVGMKRPYTWMVNTTGIEQPELEEGEEI